MHVLVTREEAAVIMALFAPEYDEYRYNRANRIDYILRDLEGLKTDYCGGEIFLKPGGSKLVWARHEDSYLVYDYSSVHMPITYATRMRDLARSYLLGRVSARDAKFFADVTTRGL